MLVRHPLAFAEVDKMKYLKTFFLLVVISVSLKSFAHEQSIAKITINKPEYSPLLTWQVRLKDLSRVANFDKDQNGEIQWGEIISQSKLLSNIIENNIKISSKSRPCSISFKSVTLANLASGNSLNLIARLSCNLPSQINYLFLKDLDELHVAYIDVKLDEINANHLFNASSDHFSFDYDDEVTGESEYQIWKFIRQGILHIWIGIDHLAFLLILLFSARLKTNANFICFRKLLTFVSVFAVAHSITLISASLNWIELPSWLVESIIAASVAWGAFRLIICADPINTKMVFLFGLIHGLGFASVLADLTGDLSSSILLLLAFNIGVEMGQIVFLIIMLFSLTLPIKYFSFQSVARVASVPVFLVSSIWVVERLAGFQILNF